MLANPDFANKNLFQGVNQSFQTLNINIVNLLNVRCKHGFEFRSQLFLRQLGSLRLIPVHLGFATIRPFSPAPAFPQRKRRR